MPFQRRPFGRDYVQGWDRWFPGLELVCEGDAATGGIPHRLPSGPFGKPGKIGCSPAVRRAGDGWEQHPWIRAPIATPRRRRHGA